MVSNCLSVTRRVRLPPGAARQRHRRVELQLAVGDECTDRRLLTLLLIDQPSSRVRASNPGA